MSNQPEICVVADTAAVWDEGARRFATAAQEAVAARGRFMVALSGGSTPEGLYRELATRHLASAPGKTSDALSVPWSQTHVFFGDERYVPHDDPQSNFRMAREALLDHVPIPARQVYPMPTDAADPADAAAEYEKILLQVFNTPLSCSEAPGEGQKPVLSTEYSVLSTPSPFPRFDLILLGMGPDGHTASLFPGTEAVHEQRHLVVAPWVEKFQTYRLTLTPPVLCHGRQVLFLLSGASKADTLRDVLEGPYEPSHLPSQIVRPVDGRLTWLIDRAAAARLEK
ncbi:MAG: 6-phosphogluconolactonase [Planctomycetes bacterium]|nr:6-phosphogluconolactonase [Planctomycetota bacterium]